MISEEAIIIAFIFKRSGKEILEESEIYLTLSIELHWFSTDEAKSFVQYAKVHKLVEGKKGGLSPTFDVHQTSVPTGFSPLKKKYEIEKEESNKHRDVFEEIVQRICENIEKNKGNVIKEIQTIQQEKQLLPEVAALLVARKYNMAIEDYFKEVDIILFKENE